MKLQSLSIAAFCTLANPVFAEAFLCDFSRGGAGGWIAQKVVVEVDAEKEEAMVMDGITLSKQEGLYPAKLSANTNGRYTVTWSVRGLKSRSNQYIIADYRLSVYKSSLDGKAIVSARGYDNTFQTNGKCERIEVR